MLIARCISALRGGAANQRGRSPRSDSELLSTSLTPSSPTPTPTPTAACLSQQQRLQAADEASRQQRPAEDEDEDEEKLHVSAEQTALCYLHAVCIIGEINAFF